MPRIIVDGRPHEVPEGTNLLAACTGLGHDLPYFCWHPAMGSIGACRQCAVRLYAGPDDTKGKIVMACTTPAADGTHLSIADPEAAQMREEVIAFLMANHPHDCPVCDEGGECQLQDMTVMVGHAYRDHRFPKRTFRSQDLGPFIHHEMNRCIQCYRCTRFYNDHAGGGDLAVLGAHDHVYFGRFEDGPFDSVFSGNLVEVCPTGVFTDRTHRRHFVRKWDLETAPSVCAHCGVGCSTTPGAKDGTVRRIRNRQNPAVNGWFLCDRGRFGYDHVNRADRPRAPLLRRAPVTAAGLEEWLGSLSGRVMGIGSPRASVEANYALRTLVGPGAFGAGVDERTLGLYRQVARLVREGPAPTATIRAIEQEVDAVLVLGEDVLHTAPRLALALRQAAFNGPRAEARAKLKLPAWEDRNLREAIQGRTGPFHVLTPDVTELDELATSTVRAAPADLARLAFAVAAALDPGAPAVDLSDEERERAARIAEDLRSARCPLVVSGVSAGDPALLDAAANVAWALRRQGRPGLLSLVLAEANAMGTALLDGVSLEELAERAAAGEADVLVVLENDLFRRAPPALVERLLGGAGTVIVVDHQATATTDRADLVLPAASVMEAAGTFVSSEGRAQRFFAVLPPVTWVRAGWRWVADLALHLGRDFGWEDLDDVHTSLAAAHPELSGVGDAAPPATWRDHGEKVPRLPHRASGRTALPTPEHVHEPKPPDDPDSPLAFSMEGTSGPLPASLRSFVWAPGWSSEQAWNRLAVEAREAGLAQDVGVRLLPPPEQDPGAWSGEAPAPFEATAGRWLVLDEPLALGGEELSARSEPVAQRIPEPWVLVGEADAEALGVRAGEVAELEVDGRLLRLEIRVSPALTRGVVRVPRDLPTNRAAWGLPLPTWGSLRPLAARRVA